MTSDDAASTILKIMSGLQAGVDVALVAGDYTLGSGDDDDIQIFDVSLKPGHARLSIKDGKILLAGGTGSLRTRNGLTLEQGGAAQEVEQLDVVTAGTTRFALGARSANWASITDDDADRKAGDAKPTPRQAQAAAGSAPWWRTWRAGLPVAAVLALTAVGIAASPLIGANPAAIIGGSPESEIDQVRAAVDKFDFGRSLQVKEDVDGALFVTGFVDKPAERRAIIGAVKDLNIPARVRLGVREVIREDVANLVAASGQEVTFDLSPGGDLTLKGVILDPKAANDLVDLVRDRVLGLTSVASQIRTAPLILEEARKLADRSQIAPLVMLRLDGAALIEASGVLPSEKIDAWVGFLQSYSNQFASLVPLRSLVRLQNPDGSMGEPGSAPTPIYLGGTDAALPGPRLDVERLRAGDYKLSEIFADQGQVAPETAAAKATDGDDEPGSAKVPLDLSAYLAPQLAGADGEDKGSVAKPELVVEPQPAVAGATGAADASPAAPTAAAVRVVDAPGVWAPAAEPVSDKLTAVGPAAGAGASDRLGAMAQELLRRWKDGQLDDTDAGRALKQGLEELNRRGRTAPGMTPKSLTERYAVLLARSRSGEPADQCWQGSRLTPRSVDDALFWLDLFSVSRDLSIRDLGSSDQALVLEAALNPKRAGACLAASPDGGRDSVYLDEVSRNSGFVAYITRDLESFPMDVAGVNLSGERFVQMRNGEKMREGAAPDQTSRIALVGELGVAVERSTGFGAILFGPELNWVTQ